MSRKAQWKTVLKVATSWLSSRSFLTHPHEFQGRRDGQRCVQGRAFLIRSRSFPLALEQLKKVRWKMVALSLAGGARAFQYWKQGRFKGRSARLNNFSEKKDFPCLGCTFLP